MRRLFSIPAVKPALALALVVLAGAALDPGFVSLELHGGRLTGPLVDVLDNAAPVVLVALGLSLVIATGGIDLSVGATMAIAATACALALRALPGLGPFTLPLLIPSALAVGACAGLFNGALVAALRVPPVVATLILYASGRGLAQILSGGTIVTFESSQFAQLAGVGWLVPRTIGIELGALALVLFLARRTAFGLYAQAIGDSPRSAHVAGLPVAGVLLASYALCGAFAALAGAIAAADIRAGDPASTGLYVELDAILAVVIGGASLRGGKAHPLGALLGALILQMLSTIVLMHGARLALALIVKALAVLAVSAIQSPALAARVRRARAA